MPTFVYRRAALRDLDQLLALERDFPSDRLSRRSFRHLLTRAKAEVWVCAANGRVIGNAVVLYRAGSKTARLYSLVTDPKTRGRGVATTLLETVEAAARRRRAARLCLEVRPDNAAAIKLYEKFGYRLAQRMEQFYEDGKDALRFERALAVPARHSALAA